MTLLFVRFIQRADDEIIVSEVDAHSTLGSNSKAMIAWRAIIGKNDGAGSFAVDFDDHGWRGLSGYKFPIPFGKCGAAWIVAADLVALFVPLFGGEFADALEEFGITNRDQRQWHGRVFVRASGRGDFEAQASSFITG